MDKEIKRREDKVRRQLARQGLALRKSRASIVTVNDLCGYMIIDAQYNRIVAGERFDLTLEDAEAYAQD